MKVLLFLAAMAALDAHAAVRVLILSGQNNHDWRTTTPYLRKILEHPQVGFDVRTTEEPSGLTAASLAGYDVLVVDYQGPRWPAATEQAIEAFVRGGRGLVAVHGAAGYSFCGNEILGDAHKKTGKIEQPWSAWREMVGACWTKDSGHGARHLFSVKPSGSHPITTGLTGSPVVSDELYHRMSLHPGAQVLATAFSAKEAGGTGRDEPIMWCMQYGKGRVFSTALGHDTVAMNGSLFATTFARGVEWAATGAVSLPGNLLPDAYRKGALRALVITGGHDHQPAFYSLFEGAGDIDAITDAHPDALRKDLSQYDVLVFHDMYKPVDQKGRDNLRRYLESGRGIVVTHHALATFNDWEWWWREVVGARYLLSAEGGMAASTYKHDQVMQVLPTANHPVLEGVPPMELMDEAYKGMWFSPDITPLLKTAHPLSDPVVAWIGPYGKSRVAVIQLGHDRWSHLNPGYRRLVRNAMFWAAGR